MTILQQLQLCAYVVTFIVSFFIFVPVSLSQEDLSGHCLLFSSGEWRFNESSGNLPELFMTSWGEQSLCNFNIFMGMTSMVASFVQIIRLSCNLSRSIPSAFLPAFVDFIVCLLNIFLFFITSMILSIGFQGFCSLLLAPASPIDECSKAESQEVVFDEPHRQSVRLHGFYSHLDYAQFGAWLSWLLWISNLILASLKLHHVHSYIGGGQPFSSSLSRETEKLMETVQAARNLPL